MTTLPTEILVRALALGATHAAPYKGAPGDVYKEEEPGLFARESTKWRWEKLSHGRFVIDDDTMIDYSPLTKWHRMTPEIADAFKEMGPEFLKQDDLRMEYQPRYTAPATLPAAHPANWSVQDATYFRFCPGGLVPEQVVPEAPATPEEAPAAPPAAPVGPVPSIGSAITATPLTDESLPKVYGDLKYISDKVFVVRSVSGEEYALQREDYRIAGRPRPESARQRVGEEWMAHVFEFTELDHHHTQMALILQNTVADFILKREGGADE